MHSGLLHTKHDTKHDAGEVLNISHGLVYVKMQPLSARFEPPFHQCITIALSPSVSSLSQDYGNRLWPLSRERVGVAVFRVAQATHLYRVLKSIKRLGGTYDDIFFSTMRMYGSSNSAFMDLGSVTK